LDNKLRQRSILVDTSIWIEFFRRDCEIGKALAGLLETGRVVITGVILFELLQGIKAAKGKGKVMELFTGLDYREMTQDIWISAGALSQTLKSKGFNLPMSDILLAAIALKHNLAIFTLDNHFDSIPGVKRHDSMTR
jgi:predicted nucleic acid-binding protein